jgi:hypothetical protein
MTPTTTYTRPASVKIENREAWLMAATERLIGRILDEGGVRPTNLRVSCGWPSRKALLTASSKSRTLGQAWAPQASEDKTREIFITPALADEVRVMDVLLHELIHVCLPVEVGHKHPFPSIAKAVGLEGKPTATVASEELVEELRVIAHELGRYPHEKLDVEPGTKKPGRMVKGSCPDCGNIFYGSRTAWEAALPECGVCRVPYVVEPSLEQAVAWGLTEAVDTEPLENVATTVELKTRDGRFTLRTTKTGKREGLWAVTDHEAVEVATRFLTGVDVVQYADRWAYRRDRADALAFIAAIRSGEVSWDDVEAEDDEDDGEVDLFDPELDAPLTDEELDGFLFLGDDEDENPDYPEDMPLPDVEVDLDGLTNVERAKLFTTRPATESEYAEVERIRDESGARKSASIIAAGGEGAMD